ncbi:hypothetical protein H0X06_01675 [Candidatus Dependentiae bacterium]|nr:hypothetical protein [Candidatus Dependentiae bacterium]
MCKILPLNSINRSFQPVFSYDSSTILVPVYKEHGAQVVSTKTGNILHKLDAEDDISYIGFNHDGTIIITGDIHGNVSFWKHLTKQYP